MKPQPTAAQAIDPFELSRRTLRDVMPRREGENHPPTPPGPTPTPPAPTPTAPGPEPTADLGALQGALDQAKVSGQTEALAPLMHAAGVTTPEALQQWITDAHTAQQAQLSETQRREQELAQREAAAATRDAEATRTARNARVLTALLTAGAPVAQANDLIPLVTLPDGDITDEQLTGAVDAAKTKFPALFGEQSAPASPPAPSSRAPKAPTPTPTPANDPFAAGRERAKKAAADRQGATKDDLINSYRQPVSPLAPTA